MFICNHCPYVKAVIEKIVETTNKLDEFGISSVAIMPNDTVNYPEDSFDNMKIFAQKHQLKFPYLIDSTQKIIKNSVQFVHQTSLVLIQITNLIIEEELVR